MLSRYITVSQGTLDAYLRRRKGEKPLSPENPVY